MASMTTPVFGGEQLVLPTMDAPVIALRRPNAGTLQDLALNRLLVGDVLNHPEFFAESGSWRLAAVIDQLNGMGWPISKRHMPAPTERAPYREMACYFLPNKFIELAQAGASGARA